MPGPIGAVAPVPSRQPPGPQTGPGNRRMTTGAPTARVGTGQNGRFARLAAQTVLLEDRAIPLDVDALHIIEHPTATADEHEQAPPAVVVLLVILKMACELVDPLGE